MSLQRVAAVTAYVVRIVAAPLPLSSKVLPRWSEGRVPNVRHNFFSSLSGARSPADTSTYYLSTVVFIHFVSSTAHLLIELCMEFLPHSVLDKTVSFNHSLFREPNKTWEELIYCDEINTHRNMISSRGPARLVRPEGCRLGGENRMPSSPLYRHIIIWIPARRRRLRQQRGESARFLR